MGHWDFEYFGWRETFTYYFLAAIVLHWIYSSTSVSQANIGTILQTMYFIFVKQEGQMACGPYYKPYNTL